jgi:hypothetical protein
MSRGVSPSRAGGRMASWSSGTPLGRPRRRRHLVQWLAPTRQAVGAGGGGAGMQLGLAGRAIAVVIAVNRRHHRQQAARWAAHRGNGAAFPGDAASLPAMATGPPVPQPFYRTHGTIYIDH